MTHHIHAKLAADNTYKVDINGQIKTVTLKSNSKGVSNPITSEELELLHQNPVFQLHLANGFLDIRKNAGEAGEISVVGDEEGEGEKSSSPTLKGSAVYAEDETFGDLTITDVVQQAFDKSGLSIEDWNSLSKNKREKLIKAEVDELT